MQFPQLYRTVPMRQASCPQVPYFGSLGLPHLQGCLVIKTYFLPRTATSAMAHVADE
jgi:hypothetical protein